MSDFWTAAADGKLVFAYRARNYNVQPPRFLNSTELTAIAASAYDETGANVPIAQQPSYIAAISAYVGWISGAALDGKEFVTLHLEPTLGPGIPANWAPERTENVRVQRGSVQPGDIEFEGSRSV